MDGSWPIKRRIKGEEDEETSIETSNEQDDDDKMLTFADMALGTIDAQTRELTDIEKALAKKVINIIIQSLEDSWNTLIPVTGKFISLDDNYQSIQVATAGEIVALLTFEVKFSSLN